MKVLAVDTSSMVATCAIMDDERLLVEYVINHKRTHSQKIMPIIKEVLENCEVKVEDIDVYAIAKGPGSFTGLRIGMATIKGLAHVADKPVVGIPTLEALAFNLVYSEGIIVPIMDARRNRVFTGMYRWENGKFHTIKDQDVIEIDELLDMLKERNERVIFNGDGTLVYKEKIISVLGESAIFAPSSVNMAKASSVAQLALAKAKKGEVESYFDIVPDYLRKSQAEREYDERNKVDDAEK